MPGASEIMSGFWSVMLHRTWQCWQSRGTYPRFRYAVVFFISEFGYIMRWMAVWRRIIKEITVSFARAGDAARHPPVGRYLIEYLPQWWIGLPVYSFWPRGRSTWHLVNFSSRVLLKARVSKLPFSRDIDKLEWARNETLQSRSHQIWLRRCGSSFEYRLDIFRVTWGGHIEHLWMFRGNDKNKFDAVQVTFVGGRFSYTLFALKILLFETRALFCRHIIY